MRALRREQKQRARNWAARDMQRSGHGAYALRRDTGAQALRLGLVEWMQEREERKESGR